jgi:hypothetical protein
MKFSIVEGTRQEAKPNLYGICPACNQPTVAKCGAIKMWHWAHKVRRTCDVWWENETEWHRKWKGRFPESWQEIVHKAENGERHIADVKTDQGWVIEFQNSYLKPEERNSRDTFYKKLVWVVNGLRRARDSKQFLNAINRGVPIGQNSHVRKVSSHECAVLQEWGGCESPVLFDFGGDQLLWWVLKWRPNGVAYVAPFGQKDFIDIHLGGASQAAQSFEAFVNDIGKLVAQYELQR